MGHVGASPDWHCPGDGCGRGRHGLGVAEPGRAVPLMSVQAIGMLGMLALVGLILLRIPVAVSMGLVGFVGYASVNGLANARTIFGQVPFDMGSSYSLSQVP